MPFNKRQHFIPRFMLRFYSSDSNHKSVNLYNIPNNNFVRNAPIKRQAYKNYFYGKDDVVDNSLKIIEDVTAKIFNKIISDESSIPLRLKKPGLLTFIAILSARTESASIALNEMVNNFGRFIISKNPEIEKSEEKYQLRIKDAAAYQVSITASILPMVMDLDCVLIKNASKKEFIFSDNPVIHFNQLLKDKIKIASNTGWACKGLQIFLPISPRHLICLFDSNVYKITQQENNYIVVNKDEDVNSLNKLQYISAHKNLYFSKTISEEYINSISSKKNRNKYKTVFRTYKSEDVSGRYLMQSSRVDIRTKLNLSFIRMNKRAKKFKVTDRVVYLRDEKLCKIHNEFTELVEKGKYKPSEFYKFIDDVATYKDK